MPAKHLKTETLHQLFEHELKDIYYAEHQMLKSLDKMAKEAENSEIKDVFLTHRKETEGHVERLKGVFELIGKTPKGQKCQGILGLIEENTLFKDEKPSREIRDLFNLSSATKAERYEISAYESLIDNALKHEMVEVIPLLRKNLEEEVNALEKVKSLIDNLEMSETAQAEMAMI